MKKVYSEIASLIIARQNCIESQNIEWFNNHTDSIEQIIDQYLPSGSGIDSGVKINYEKSNGNKLVFESSFHNMNDAGYYNGWTDFTITIIPSLTFGFELKIKGNFSNSSASYGLKDDLYDIFQYAFDQEIKENES